MKHYTYTALDQMAQTSNWVRVKLSFIVEASIKYSRFCEHLVGVFRSGISFDFCSLKNGPGKEYSNLVDFEVICNKHYVLIQKPTTDKVGVFLV